MPTWVVVARYGSNRLGAYRQQEAALSPRNLRAYGAHTFAVAVWDGQPDVLYEVQCAHTGNQFVTVAFVTGSSTVVPMEAASVSVRVRGIARDGYTTNWCAAASAQRSGDATALLQSKGDLLTFGTDLTVLPLGTNGQVLTVDTSTDAGLKWAEPTPLTTKGDLLSFASAGLARLPVGTNGQILSADSAEPTGLKWINPPASSPLTSKGDLYTHTGAANTRLPVGANGQILSADSTETTGLKWINPPATSPLTSKGDLYTHTGTANARLPVGTNGQVLTADNTEPTGLKWQTPVSAGLPLTDPGDLLTRDGAGLVRLPVGSQGQYLRVNTSNPTKLEWSNAPPPSGGNTIQKRVLLHEFVAVGGESGTFWTITNLSQNYRDLVVQTHGRLSTSSASGQIAIFMYYNNDFNTANYGYNLHVGGSSHFVYSANAAPPVWFGYRANAGNGAPSAYDTVVYSYTSLLLKVSRTIGGEYSYERWVVDLMNSWLNSAAINRLDFRLASGYFLEAGFQIRVYGVRDEAEPTDANAVLAAPPIIGSTTPNEGRFTDIRAGAANAFYFGDSNTDGTWRIRRDGNNLVFERRVSGNYVVQFTVPAV
jgi:hypothetical protein